MHRSFWLLLAFVAFLGIRPSTSHAAFITDVADSFDKENKNPFDARIRLTYEFFSQSANIYREKAHPNLQYFCYGTANGCTNYPQFSVSHIRHTLNFRVAIGLYKDFELSVNLPLVVYESIASTLTEDAKRNADGSSLRKDGIVPYDNMESRHNSVLGDLSIALRWAPFNDYRDPTVATLEFGFTWTFPTGTVWNPLDLKPETASSPNILTGAGVGRGTHIGSWHIAVSKRLWFADPYIRVTYNVNLTPDGQLREGILDPNWVKTQEALLNQLQTDAQNAKDTATRDRLTQLANNKASFIKNARLSALSLFHQAEVIVGSEFVFWENKMKGQKIFLDLRFGLVATFQGRSQTLFTDMLSQYRPTVRERGQDVPERASLITDHEDFFTLFFQPAIHFFIGKYGYIRIAGSFGSTLPFFLTRAKRGTDVNQNGFVDLQTDEVYPFHVRTLDGVGKRIQQRDTFLAAFQFTGGLTF